MREARGGVLVIGRVTEIDEEARSAQVETPDAGAFEIHYDQLVLALGAVPRTFPVPGLAEHGLGFKDLADAIHLRNRVLRELEAADAGLASGDVATHLGFVFVGAGYAGVEALGELADLSHDALRWYPRLRGAPQRWVLVDAAPKILAEIPSRLGDYAAHTLVWTAGVKASPTLDQFGMPLDERGRVTVDPYLRVAGRERVWALGDCAAVPNQATPGRLDPPTCQHALRQARRLAGNLSGDLAPYRYRMLGQVATLGRYKGIADVLGIKLRGFPGWFVTRSYHLFQLPLVSRKLRVVVDWTTSLFFRRDIAELSGLGAPPRRVTSPGRLRRGRPLAGRLPERLQGRRERLLRRQHAVEQVALSPDALEHGVHREGGRVERVVHLVPAKWCRERGPRLRPHRVRGGDRLPLAVLA